MTNKTIEVPPAHVRAIAHFMAKRDVRYYLNGMLLEASETETRLVATDGHICGVCRSQSVNGMGGDPDVSMLLPAAAVAYIAKLSKRIDAVNIRCIDGAWSVETPDGTLHTFTPIDGRFPDYRRIWPHAPSGKVAHFNPSLLYAFQKAAVALGRRTLPVIEHNGDGGAAVHIPECNAFAGVIMPMRVKDEHLTMDVDWVRGPLAA